MHVSRLYSNIFVIYLLKQFDSYTVIEFRLCCLCFKLTYDENNNKLIEPFKRR